MDTINISPAAKSAAIAHTPAKERHLKLQASLRRRSVWLIGALLVAGAGAFGYH